MNTPPEVTAAFLAATEKQKKLAVALAKGMDRKDAMLEAGYAKSQAIKCLKSVVEHPVVVTLASHYAEQAIKKNEVSVERVVEEVCRVVLTDIRAAFDENGNLLDIHSLPDDIARSISRIEVFEEYRGKGDERESIGQTKKLQFWNKLDAIEKLAKIKGWYAPEKHVHDVNPLVKLMQEVSGAALPVVPKDPDHG